MTPALSQHTLAEHALIRECLKAHGFEPTGRSRFSNGRATVHFEGTRLVAIPGDGSRTWRSDVGSVPPEAVVALLDALLATPPFLSPQEIDRRLARAHAAKIALDRIVELISWKPRTPHPAANSAACYGRSSTATTRSISGASATPSTSSSPGGRPRCSPPG